MKTTIRFLLLSLVLAISIHAQLPPTTLYNTSINLSSIGRDYYYDDDDKLQYYNTYVRDPSEATNKIGNIPSRVYRMYSGFQSLNNSILTGFAGHDKAEATEFTITYTGPASNQTVNIKIGTTMYSSTDGSDAWSGVSSYSISKSVSGSGVYSLTSTELSTVTNWIKNGNTIYFGAVMNNEKTDQSYFLITNVLVKYKKRFNIAVTIDRLYDQSSVISLNTQPITGSGGTLPFDEGTSVNAIASTVVTQSTINKFVFSNMVFGGTTYNTSTPTFPGLYSDQTLIVHYNPAVEATLKNLVTYNGNTDIDLSSASMDIFNGGSLYASAPTPYINYLLPKDVSMTFKTVHGTNGQTNNYLSSGANIKHQNWNESFSDPRLVSNAVSKNVAFNQFAKYKQLQSTTVQISLDGITQSASGVQFKDPWKTVVDGQGNVTQPGNWDSYAVPFTPGTGSYASYGGVFQSVIYLDDTKAHYRVKTDVTKTIDGSLSTFYNWQTSSAFANSSSAVETPIRFDAANATVTAIYKGKLRTGRPDLADTKNQRRFVSNGNSWVTVYESMGDIWINCSADGGGTWGTEKRLNTLIGQASNPTISNGIALSHYSNSSDHAIVSWIEGSGAIHLQTIKISSANPVHIGWSNYSQGQNSTNHRTLYYDFSIPSTHSTGRPVIALLNNGNNFICTIAYEKDTHDGIRVAQLLFEGSGESTEDLDGASVIYTIPLQRSISISSHASDNSPVVIAYPASYGYPEKTYVYYLAGSYASGTRIAQYDYVAQQTSVLANPNNDYTYYSLQGATSPGNNSYGLVAEAIYSSVYKVNYYYKATYMGSGAPSLTTVFTDMRQPSLMFDQSTGFGSSSSAGTPVMKSTSNNSFYQYVSSSLAEIGPNIGGIFNKERTVYGDRTAIVVKTTTTPATLVKYIGGGLAKSEGSIIAMNRQAVRIIEDAKGNKQRIALDLSDAKVEVVDSLENDIDLCVVKVHEWNNSVICQIDSLRAPLAVTLKRNGNATRSYSPSLWNTLTSANLPDVQQGDIITFSFNGMKKTTGFTVLRLKENGLDKENDYSDALIPTKQDISIYPNPFNPTTTFRISLPQPAQTRLSVFNMLGQKVAVVVDNNLSAGHNEFKFDGSSLSSGVYIYRLEIGKEIRSGRMMLVK